MQHMVHSLFPTPVMVGNIDRNFTKSELAVVEEKINDSVPNADNETSADNYVLNESGLSRIKVEIEDFVQLYMDEVIQPINDFEPCLTQSWLNTTMEGGSHHYHCHPNSYLSGVLYIKADMDSDSVTFVKNEYNQIEVDSKILNKFNSQDWAFSVGTGSIVLFPSKLHHKVDKKTSSSLRVSLAFNVMPKGIYGGKVKLTEWVYE